MAIGTLALPIIAAYLGINFVQNRGKKSGSAVSGQASAGSGAKAKKKKQK